MRKVVIFSKTSEFFRFNFTLINSIFTPIIDGSQGKVMGMYLFISNYCQCFVYDFVAWFSN